MLATILITCAVLYFTPTLIAVMGGKRNGFAIFALNLLGGWTAAGWLIALVWSLTREPAIQVAAGPFPAVLGHPDAPQLSPEAAALETSTPLKMWFGVLVPLAIAAGVLVYGSTFGLPQRDPDADKIDADFVQSVYNHVEPELKAEMTLPPR